MAKDIIGGELQYQSEQAIAMGAGFIAAFIAGLVACTWMIQLVKKSKLSYFAIYCFIVGCIAIGFGLLG
jgi:undecaprenyl-diphosphatase